MVSLIVVGVLQANCYIVADVGSREALVIDPGDEGERIEGFIVRENLHLKLIVNTHFHFDHAGANAYLKEKFEVPIAIGHKDAPFLKRAYLAAVELMIKSSPSPEADLLLKENNTIEIGSYKLKVIETPGHTPGSICLYDANQGLLFSGDTLFYESVGRWDLPGGDEKQLFESLKKIINLPDKTIVYPGHGIETTIGHEKTHNPFIKNLQLLK